MMPVASEDTHNLDQQISACRAQGLAICKHLASIIHTLIEDNPPPIPDFDRALFSLVTDPYSQTQDLNADWQDDKGRKCGQIRFHGDGSFYAEYDVLRPHPYKQAYFVEAIHAWGREDLIKSEPRLLEIPQD